MSETTRPQATRAGEPILLPPAIVLIARDRGAVLALGLLLAATGLLVVAVFVGFSLYLNTDISSAASIGITAVPALAIWTVALVVGVLMPPSRLNRARCALLQAQTGATHVWPLTQTASIDDLITKVSTDGLSSSLTAHKMLLGIDSEHFSFWLMRKRQLRRVLTLPTSALIDATTQFDPGSGSPLGVKISLTVRTPDRANTRVQFNQAPTTMHLLTEPNTTAATFARLRKAVKHGPGRLGVASSCHRLAPSSAGSTALPPCRRDLGPTPSVSAACKETSHSPASETAGRSA